MKKEKYVIVEWPESQLFMDNHKDDIHLINDESGRSRFGNAAYFVEEGLYKKVRAEFEKEAGIQPCAQSGLEKG